MEFPSNMIKLTSEVLFLLEKLVTFNYEGMDLILVFFMLGSQNSVQRLGLACILLS